jgi:hypothetical protein
VCLRNVRFTPESEHQNLARVTRNSSGSLAIFAAILRASSLLKQLGCRAPAGLEAATRALDRILLWNHYVVPQWYYNKVRTARWDRFVQPNPMPKTSMHYRPIPIPNPP